MALEYRAAWRCADWWSACPGTTLTAHEGYSTCDGCGRRVEHATLLSVGKDR